MPKCALNWDAGMAHVLQQEWRLLKIRSGPHALCKRKAAANAWINPPRQRADSTGHAVHAAQGSLFSALLTDMMEAVRWPAQPAAASLRGSPRASPKAAAAPASAAAAQQRPSAAARVLLAVSSSSALSPSGSPNARVRTPAASIATVALTSHPFRPLYLSGAPLSSFLWHLLRPFLATLLLNGECIKLS
jgi:hypothetical protein